MSAQLVASWRAAPVTSRSPMTRDHCTGSMGPAEAGRTMGPAPRRRQPALGAARAPRRSTARRDAGAAAGPKRQHAHQRHLEAGARIRRERQVAPAENRGLVVELHVLGARWPRRARSAAPDRTARRLRNPARAAAAPRASAARRGRRAPARSRARIPRACARSRAASRHRRSRARARASSRDRDRWCPACRARWPRRPCRRRTR